MTELEKQTIIKEVLSSLQVGKDFTISTLSELIQVPKKEVSDLAHRGLIHGVYKAGKRFRFSYGVIMLKRATGENVFKEPAR